MGNQIVGLYKLSRPLSTLTGVLATLLGGYVAGTGEWLNIALAGLTTLFVSSAANAWNDYQDVEIDRINQPNRPLPSGRVPLRTALIFSLVLAGLSLVVAAFISWPAFAITALSNVILYLYSVRLKSTVILGNVTVAFISALSTVFGGVAAGNVVPSLWLGAVIGSGILAREMLKDLADYDGDKAKGVKTFATVYGREAAAIASRVLLTISSVVMVLPYFFGGYSLFYLLIVLFGVIPVGLYVLVGTSPARSGPELERRSQILKWDFLVWFAAVLLGAPTWPWPLL